VSRAARRKDPKACECGILRYKITRMSTLEDAEFVTHAAAELAGPLHAALDHGTETVRAHFAKHDMTGQGYAKERTELTRAHARKRLESSLIGDWQLAIEAPTGTLWLRRELMFMRILHVAPEGMVPAPGHNTARINYFLNPDLDLFGVGASRLLGLWLVDPKTQEIMIRVLRPLGHWRHGHTAKVDIDFVLPRDGDEFSNWEFVPDDAGINVSLNFEGEEGQEGDGVAGW
jgi:hypothetical protein